MNATQNLLMYLVMPLWLLAGLADWAAHRATHIEKTSGTRESVLHIVLLLQMGIPLLAALFIQVNAAFFLMSGLALLIHQITIYIDLRYANSRRAITPFEQMVHGVQEIIPLTALLMLASLHWEQFAGMFAAGSEAADFSIRPKEVPLPGWYTLAALLLGFAVSFLYVEELARCVKFNKADHERHQTRRRNAKNTQTVPELESRIGI